MPNRRLSTADKISLINSDFKNERWERAAQEILEFWDDGVQSFLEMGDRGEWSRTLYSDVFDAHFRAQWPDDPQIDGDSDALSLLMTRLSEDEALEIYRQLYREIYSDAFADGVNWTRQD